MASLNDCALLNPPAHARLVYVMRSDVVESVHYGSIAIVDPNGELKVAVGDPSVAHYPRSALNPIQAAGMVRLGLVLPDDLLALASASHLGEPHHIQGVMGILEKHGLTAEALRNPVGVVKDFRREGSNWGAKARLLHFCSGKHAAMLATARTNRWGVVNYLDPHHPVQKGIKRSVEELSGERAARTAVDGCGAPLLALSLAGLARAVGRLARAKEGSTLGAVARAIRTHPILLGGNMHPTTELIRSVPGLIAKEGVEGVFVAALPDGTAVAIKIADGSPRVRFIVAAAALIACGVPRERLARFLNNADESVSDGFRLVPDLTG